MSNPASVPFTPGSTIGNIVATGMLGNFSSIVTELSEDGLGLGEEEAQDFGNLVDTFTENLETGMTASAAWTAAEQPFIAAEKSQLWNAAMGALKQVVSQFDSFIAVVKALI